MKECLQLMNNTGNECQPEVTYPLEQTKSALGPKYLFWKGLKDMDDGQGCFDVCEPCLTESIDEHQPGTTKCRVINLVALGPAEYWSCQMGYDNLG